MINHKRLDRFILLASRMKMIIAKEPDIPDRKLSQKLGVSFQEFKEVKEFCIMNKMRVNEPNKNPVKKDLRLAKKV